VNKIQATGRVLAGSTSVHPSIHPSIQTHTHTHTHTQTANQKPCFTNLGRLETCKSIKIFILSHSHSTLSYILCERAKCISHNCFLYFDITASSDVIYELECSLFPYVWQLLLTALSHMMNLDLDLHICGTYRGCHKYK
jgi:hypothetical protein